MISAQNKPLNYKPNDEDFTTHHYRELCHMAVKQYPITTYDKFCWGDRFILWRHDIDFSLNRAFVLAKIEHETGLHATYFLNPHAEFYNLAEASQHAIVKHILGLGHHIGLHFDAAFFGRFTASELDDAIAREADYLQCLFGIQPVAFSFHNPDDHTLQFDSDIYGGLLNCYSKQFKSQVPYISDSNGYWRHRRLFDVLQDGIDPCLQVLTHPGWWQDKAMPARERILRCVYGRAEANMQRYDNQLEASGRINQKG